MGLLLFGVKLELINAFGSDLPFTDQWDAEGRNLIVPYLDRGLWAIEWLAPHNVHRILTTRLFALGLFVANGQWDALVECVFGALVHIASAVLLAQFVRRQVAPGPARSILIAVIVVGFASPYGWSNTLLGFQCQYDFFLLASLSMLVLASRERLTWATGLALVGLGLISYFSVAGGVFSCVATVACLLVTRISPARRTLRGVEATCAGALLSIAAAGYAFTPSVKPTTGFEGQTIVGAFRALYHGLSFPTTAGAVLLWVPCTMLALRTVRKPGRVTRLGTFAVGLALFVLLIAIGIASQRGDDVASRYTDLLWFGLFANLIALHELARHGFTSIGRWKLATFTAYAVVVSGLLVDSGLNSLDQASRHKANLDLAAANLADFVRTNDHSAFEGDRAHRVPHPSPEVVESILRDDRMRAALPPSIRLGLLDRPDAIASTDFRSPGADPAGPASAASAASAATIFGTYGLPGASGSARLVSNPIDAGSGPLAIRLIGTAAPGEVAASISTADGQRKAFRIRGIGADHWSTSVVSGSSTSFVFSLTKTGEDGRWVAFSGPVEIGRLRPICDFLLFHANTIVAFGLAAFLVSRFGGRSAFERRSSPFGANEAS